MSTRYLVLDTETTGLEPKQGHKIIEIGCVEVIERRVTGEHYQQYLNPEREIDDGALAVHGITSTDLEDKPTFAQIADDFLKYIEDATLVIHNAAFDVGFLNHEFSLLPTNFTELADHCEVIDTLELARKMHPGQRNSLDALCQRYHVDNAHRSLHGALLDAEILADVYLMMTGGQLNLLAESDVVSEVNEMRQDMYTFDKNRAPIMVVQATDAEMVEHEKWLQLLRDSEQSS